VLVWEDGTFAVNANPNSEEFDTANVQAARLFKVVIKTPRPVTITVEADIPEGGVPNSLVTIS
jgi:hypothetical protein